MAEDFILGAGMTGLAAARASGLPVYEAADSPGGICSSYYQAGYRFEIGGGHWIFGGDPVALRFMESLAKSKSYARRASVFLPDRGLFLKYPLQNNLEPLDRATRERALAEMEASRPPAGPTMGDWLQASFGPALGKLFFEPFHQLYTSGLWRTIAPQDAYKSPKGRSKAAGYNVTFLYPEDGLDALARRISRGCDVRYGKRVVAVDVNRREVRFADGASLRYRSLLSTLPLNRMMALTGLKVKEKPDPSSAVLVVNIGAVKGRSCPRDHWVYFPKSRSGFHRVGFYSNVDPSFLPQGKKDRVGIYVEKAFRDARHPTPAQTKALCQSVVRELQDLRWIGKAEAVDPTWIDVAYTWSWPGNTWKASAIKALEARGVYQIGRYGRWLFQGIADSLRDGLTAGAAFRP